MFSMLPDAIMREREAMLNGAVDLFKKEGYEGLQVQDLEGYPQPDDGIVRVINAPVQPDLTARAPDDGAPVTAFVEVSTALSDDNIGRRWQYLSSWTAAHGGRMRIFVHPEDLEKAASIARHWHIGPECVEALSRH